MTTTITLVTHDWPTQVETADHTSSVQACGGIEQRVHHYLTTSEVVPPNSQRQFYITDSRSITFVELPIPTEVAAVDASAAGDDTRIDVV